MSKLFLYFCTILALFLSISGFYTVRNISDLPFHLIFLPVTLYLLFTSAKNLPRSRRIPEVALSKKSTSLGIMSFIFAAFLTRGVLTLSSQSHLTLSPTPTPQPLIVSQKATSSPTPTTFPVMGTIVITHPSPKGEVNVRSNPTTSSDIVKKVISGESYSYSSIEGKWYMLVLDPQLTGWIHSDYIIIPTPTP